MASKRLLDKRREHEAAEKQGKTKAKAATKTAAKKKSARGTTVRKRKAKAPERKRLMWGVFSGALKEEGRFAWNEKNLAEEKLAQLRAKSKKLYFIQPIKEAISDSARPPEDVVVEDEEILDEEAAIDDEDDLDDADAEDEDDSEEE